MAYAERRGKKPPYSYRLTIEHGCGPNGKRLKTHKTIHAKDFGKDELGTRELKKELAKFVAEVEGGGYVEIEKMTFDQLANEWKVKFVEKQLEAKTEQNYKNILQKRLLPYFKTMKMEKITSLVILDFLEKLREDGLSAGTIVKYYRVLRSIFNFAKKHKVIKENPMEAVDKPKESKPKTDVYSKEEVDILLGLLRNENLMFRTLITLAVLTGLRRGELLALEWRHVFLDKDSDTGYVEVIQSIPMFKDGKPIIKEPKTTNSVRKVSLPKAAVDVLREYQKSQRNGKNNVQPIIPKWEGGERYFLFCNSNGIPFYPKTLGDMWRSFIKRVNADNLQRGLSPKLKYIRFHDLRHTAATLLILKGAHAKIISSRLGHSKISTTLDLYGHALQSADQAAAALLDDIGANLQQSQAK